MKNLKSKTLLLTATTGVLLALTGCSSASDKPAGTTTAAAENTPVAVEITAPDATEIFPKTAAAVKNATSVTVSGDMSKGSESVKMKLSGNKDGSNTKANIATKDGTLELLIVDGANYLKADKKFLAKTAGKEAAGMITTMVGDKWISVKDSSQFGNFNLGSMLDGMDMDSTMRREGPKVTAKSVEDLNGVKTFKYVGDETDFWIAAEGEPFLVKVEANGPASDTSGNMTFSDWNAVAPHKAPAKTDVISVPGL